MGEVTIKGRLYEKDGVFIVPQNYYNEFPVKLNFKNTEDKNNIYDEYNFTEKKYSKEVLVTGKVERLGNRIEDKISPNIFLVEKVEEVEVIEIPEPTPTNG